MANPAGCQNPRLSAANNACLDLSDVPIRTLLGPASRLTPSLEAPEKATETITAPKGLLAALAGKKARPDPYGYRLDRLY